MRLALIVLVLAAVATASSAQERTKSANDARERINKVWDERLNRILQARLAAECKAEAKKSYSAIRFNKRRMFVEECISKASAPTAMPAAHQVN